MKELTCKQIGGPCDARFRGSTPGEVTEAVSEHIIEMAKTDLAHKESLDEMLAIYSDTKQHEKWHKKYQKTWNEAPTL